MRWRWMAAVLLGAGVLLLADSQVRIVRISFLAHGVQVRHPASDGEPARWTPALLNAPVVEAEQFRTEANGEAEIELECGSALRLAPDSELTATRLRLRDDGVRRTTMTLTSGEAYFTLRRADATDFQVDFAGAVISTPYGATSLRLQLPANGQPTVEMLSGRGELTLGGRNYELKKHVRWALEEGGGLLRLAAAAPDEYQRWSHDRDMRFEREMAAARPTTGMDAAATGPQPSDNISPSTMILNPAGGFATLDAANPDPLFASAPMVRKVPSCAGN